MFLLVITFYIKMGRSRKADKKNYKNNHLAEVISSGPLISLNEKGNLPVSRGSFPWLQSRQSVRGRKKVRHLPFLRKNTQGGEAVKQFRSVVTVVLWFVETG